MLGINVHLRGIISFFGVAVDHLEHVGVGIVPKSDFILKTYSTEFRTKIVHSRS